MKQITIILFFAFSCTAANAATAWELKKDKDGIKVYAGDVANSNVKAVKAECILNASLSQLAALLLDAKAHEQWVYSTKTSYMVKRISSQEQVYYSEMSMPWPITNRDIVVDIKVIQDPATKVLTVSAQTVSGYIPAKSGTVRVLSSKVNWTVTAIGNNQVKIEYEAQADPGGSVPAWAVNMFCDKGPFETFKKLRETLLEGAYRNASVDFVKN